MYQPLFYYLISLQTILAGQCCGEQLSLAEECRWTVNVRFPGSFPTRHVARLSATDYGVSGRGMRQDQKVQFAAERRQFFDAVIFNGAGRFPHTDLLDAIYHNITVFEWYHPSPLWPQHFNGVWEHRSRYY